MTPLPQETGSMNPMVGYAEIRRFGVVRVKTPSPPPGIGMRMRYASYPYPHIRLHPLLDGVLAEGMLSWLYDTEAWRRRDRSFYRHDSFAVEPGVIPPDLEAAVSPHWLKSLRELLQSQLNVKLQSFAWVEAHRSSSRDEVGVHTDAGANEVRVVLNLNTGWAADHGGLLLLQDRPVSPRHCVGYLPLHNTATAFRTTAASYHRVSPIRKSQRYALLYRFPIDEPQAAIDEADGRLEQIVLAGNSHWWPSY